MFCKYCEIPGHDILWCRKLKAVQKEHCQKRGKANTAQSQGNTTQTVTKNDKTEKPVAQGNAAEAVVSLDPLAPKIGMNYMVKVTEILQTH